MAERSGSRLRRVLGFLLFAFIVAAVVLAVTHRVQIKDYFAASGFDPSSRTVEVMEDLNLTPTGERVFLASRPTVDGSQHFNEQCAGVNHSDEGHVLGCFTGEEIHLFDVTDERVSGIVDVTAAHELLHATYSRLGDGDRVDLAARLRAAYDELASENNALSERMAVYEHLSDSAFANELHSVLGTEVVELPDWLEQHYAQWFSDRGELVDQFASYHSVFVDLQQQAESLQADMTALRADVEERKVSYDAAVQSYNDDAAEFSARNARFEFSDAEEEFIAIRGDLEYRRSVLESTLAALQSDISRYNSMRDQLQELSDVSSELDQQLDSDLAPVTTRPNG